MVFGLCLVGVVLFVLLGCFLFCLPLFFVSAWWNRGIADEVTIASFCKAVTGTAVMARSANEEKKNPESGEGRKDNFQRDGARLRQTGFRGECFDVGEALFGPLVFLDGCGEKQEGPSENSSDVADDSLFSS